MNSCIPAFSYPFPSNWPAYVGVMLGPRGREGQGPHGSSVPACLETHATEGRIDLAAAPSSRECQHNLLAGVQPSSSQLGVLCQETEVVDLFSAVT